MQQRGKSWCFVHKLWYMDPQNMWRFKFFPNDKIIYKNQTKMSKFVCIICKENTENLTSNENDLPENEISFQFQEEHLQDITLDDPTI